MDYSLAMAKGLVSLNETMLCRATQDRQVIVKSSDKMQSTGGGNGNPV